MTVADFIAELQKMPQDAEVLWSAAHDNSPAALSQSGENIVLVCES